MTATEAMERTMKGLKNNNPVEYENAEKRKNYLMLLIEKWCDDGCDNIIITFSKLLDSIEQKIFFYLFRLEGYYIDICPKENLPHSRKTYQEAIIIKWEPNKNKQKI